VLRVTLDTNIYVSALEFGGVGARLLGMARAGMIGIDVSDAILDELVTVLRDDFAWEAYRLRVRQHPDREGQPTSGTTTRARGVIGVEASAG